MSGLALLGLLFLGLLVFSGGTCALWVCVRTSTSHGTKPTASAAPARTSDCPYTGEYGYVYRDDKAGFVFLFPTTDLLDEWESAAARKDTTKMMAIASVATKVPSGTRVKVVDLSFLLAEVEVVEGSQRLRRGWMEKGELHRKK